MLIWISQLKKPKVNVCDAFAELKMSFVYQVDMF